MIPISSSRSSSPTNLESHPRVRHRTDNRKDIVEGSGTGVRPRNKRLDPTKHGQELFSTSTTSTPEASRAVSPIPSRHPSRTVSRDASSNGRNGRTSTMSLSGLGWDGTWASKRLNAFQEIAFSMLGGATEGNPTDSLKTVRPSIKKDGWFGKGKTPSAWGPDTDLPRKEDQGIGAGGTEARDADMKARRRARVLEGRDESISILDNNGNFKRRTSAEDQRPASVHDDEDALVYMHHVQPNDTIQGVVLKYHCQMDVFKKANRFWAGDSIQTRKTVLLPVDACAIKGRPCELPTPNSLQGIDLLAPTPILEESPLPNTSTWETFQDGRSAEPSGQDERRYAHVSWVLLDTSPSSKPVEIIRVPRGALNYFPPRRRKSVATLSTISTPRASFDLGSNSRSRTNDAGSSTASTPSRRISNLGLIPTQLAAIDSYFPSPAITTSQGRVRRESVGETADRLGWLRGPGGVGTLGKNVKKPGPGKDVLNTWTKKHIPSLAIDSLPSTLVLGAESAQLGFDRDYMAGTLESAGKAAQGSGSPGYGFPNLNMAPAAVENWVRKLATKSVLPGTPRGGMRPTEPVLIEMLDGTGSDDGRGFELDPGSVRSSTPLGASGRENIDGLIRGRGKSGKSD